MRIVILPISYIAYTNTGWIALLFTEVSIYNGNVTLTNFTGDFKMPTSVNRLVFPLLILSLILSGLISACSTLATGHPYPMASMEGMPAEVQSAPVTVQQAYQFAYANEDVLTQLPCYCGCGSIGHTSNYACYVAEQNPDGSIAQFDNHALGCSICIDITQDAMRLLDDGKSVPEIRAYVDQTYAKYGPSNMP